MSTPAPKLVEIRQDSTLLSIDGAAEYLGITKSTMLKLMHGKVPGPRIRFARVGARKVIIRRAWLDRWIEESARFHSDGR